MRFDISVNNVTGISTAALIGNSATSGIIHPWKVEAVIVPQNSLTSQLMYLDVEWVSISTGATASTYAVGSGLIRQDASVGGYSMVKGQGYAITSFNFGNSQPIQLFFLNPVAHANVATTLHGATAEIL